MQVKNGIETVNLLNCDSKTKGIDKDGALVNAKFNDQFLHSRIIARSKLIHNCICIEKNPESYYLNRRMDAWIQKSDITLLDEEIKRVIIAEELAHRDKKRKKLAQPMLDEAPSELRQEIEEELDHDEHEGMDEASIREHEEVTKLKNVRSIEIGKYIMDAWYFSPFPKEYYPDGIIDRIYFCEFCLSFYKDRRDLINHVKKCTVKCPPGDEIYRKDNISMFEVDGAGTYQQHIYCQNLSFLAKLFLDHKTLYYDVDPFFFYCMCERDNKGYHIVGYFSKEKYSEQGYNLACILTLPCYQRRGFGHFLIDFSYALSKIQEKVGSPEKPLSDLGQLSFRAYWTKMILRILKDQKDITIFEIAKMTSILPEDIQNTCKYLGIIEYRSNGSYVFSVPEKLIEEKLRPFKEKKLLEVDPSCLIWEPYIPPEGKYDKYSLAAKINREEVPMEDNS